MNIDIQNDISTSSALITIILAVLGGLVFYIVLDKINKKEDFLTKLGLLKHTFFFIIFTGVIASSFHLIINQLSIDSIMVKIIILIVFLLLPYPLVYITTLLVKITMVGSINKRILREHKFSFVSNRIKKFIIFTMQLMLLICVINTIALG
ncbi:hypothetical protein [Staphylococcus equorum]|uniref:hypothetical protein n=1 Tax=Staphylococcus equorum TaxID=246432 RepID=UPI000853606B|nr:hypothetical protein [Staphylococcus equorum]OEL08264.1 hypothetical protein AST04_08750 [Staphylococcus equorum]